MRSLPALRLSLQFGAFPELAMHRAALPRHAVTRCIRHALERDADITVRVVGFEEGCALNRTYRHKGHATNVLTFNYAANPVHADLVLCGPLVWQEAQALGKSLQEHYAHLMVHGTLHAQGYDHELGAAQARAMQAIESKTMAALGWGNPHPS